MPASRSSLVRARLESERGRLDKDAPFRVGLLYPSPYAAGMSSLGYQRIYRAIQEEPGLAAERIFLDDDAAADLTVQERPLSYEGDRPLEDFPVIAASVAYEIEIGGLVRMFDAAGLPALARDRDERHPFVLAGGPLTFSNPLPLAPLVDAIIVGEAEELLMPVLRIVEAGVGKRRDAVLAELAALPHVFVPAVHGATLPVVAKAAVELLPAWAPIRSPHAELRDMFLIEAERGCSRACTYCVMRRSTNGGMRLVPMERILELVPKDATRVGLVGAAASDHPRIVQLVSALADRGLEVGLSSLRPDRLSDDFVFALKRGGYKTLTTAMDGPSDRMRTLLERKAKEKHIVRAAELARAHKMDRLKLYLMIGLPHETDDDIDECIAFVSELSKIVPVSLGIAPFCAKRNTPLDGQPFAGVDVVHARLERLRRGFRGRVDVRSTSAKWAWVEYVLAQGGPEEGLAVVEAVRAGGRYADFRRAFGTRESAAVRPRRSLAIAPV